MTRWVCMLCGSEKEAAKAPKCCGKPMVKPSEAVPKCASCRLCCGGR